MGILPQNPHFPLRAWTVKPLLISRYISKRQYPSCDFKGLTDELWETPDCKAQKNIFLMFKQLPYRELKTFLQYLGVSLCTWGQDCNNSRCKVAWAPSTFNLVNKNLKYVFILCTTDVNSKESQTVSQCREFLFYDHSAKQNGTFQRPSFYSQMWELKENMARVLPGSRTGWGRRGASSNIQKQLRSALNKP